MNDGTLMMVIGTWVMAGVTLISVLVALYEVRDGRLRYIDSILPIISFKLIYSSSHLDLEVLNTGKSPAHNLKIDILQIFGLSDAYTETQDNYHGVSFDLSPEEEVCNHIVQITSKPSKVLIQLKVTFSDDWEKEHMYCRSVFLYEGELFGLIEEENEIDESEQQTTD